MTRLILVRHGETLWNASMRFQGQTDTELSTKGQEQARRTASRLAGENIDIAYASDLRRCAETAEIILDGREVELRLRPELRELNFGRWEGLTFEQINAISPGVLQRMRSELRSFEAPEGESWADLEARVTGMLDEILVQHPNGTVLIVAHVNPLRILLGRLLQVEGVNWLPVRLYNCSISIFEVDAGQAKMHTLNDSCHLEDELQ